jgi:small subunit ribosomal protein S7
VKFSTKNYLPTSSDGKGPNTETLPSISEEAEALNKIRGEEPPDLEVGTPVEEVLKRDKDALENAPKDIKDAIKKTNGTGKRSFSTTSSKRAELVNTPDDSSDILMTKTLPTLPEEWEAEPLPSLKPEDTLVGRYPAILEQFTGLIMRHGKKGVAQQVRKPFLLPRSQHST